MTLRGFIGMAKNRAHDKGNLPRSGRVEFFEAPLIIIYNSRQK